MRCRDDGVLSFETSGLDLVMVGSLFLGSAMVLDAGTSLLRARSSPELGNRCFIVPQDQVREALRSL